ncbi:MAG: recombination protein RecR, partial [Dehalococcoides mccartyi]
MKDTSLPSTAGVVNKLIDSLGKLPVIGPKSAQRLAFYLMRAPEDQVISLSDTIRNIKNQISQCRICCNVADSEL